MGFRTLPSIYPSIELAWGKLCPLGCLEGHLECPIDHYSLVRPLLSRHQAEEPENVPRSGVGGRSAVSGGPLEWAPQLALF